MFTEIFLTFLLFVILVAFVIYVKLIQPEKRVYDELHAQGVPGEPFVPLLGQLPEIRRYRQNDETMMFLTTLTKKHGNISLFGFGPLTRLMLTEPSVIADVLSRKNAPNYIKPQMFSTVFIPLIGRHNLLVAEGDEHERARRMINPAFYHENLKSMVSIIANQTIRAIDGLISTETNKKCSTEKTIDLQAEFNALTLSIIASSAFGSGFETITNAKDVICRLTGEVLDAISYRSMILVNQTPFLSKLPFWKKNVVDKGAHAISELVDQIILERRQGQSSSLSDGPDLLDLLLSAVDDHGKRFNDEEIKQESLTFVLAGSETTGNLMVWLFYVLMTNESILKACQDEVDRVLADGKELSNENLADLVICEAVINETLRLYPPAPVFVRQCIREHTVGTEHPLRVPYGTTIIINNYALHRRSDLWPNPEQFDYTRWMRDPTTHLKPKLPHPFAYLPFAAGPRNCIGQNFALLEAKIILALLVSRCDFEIVPGQKIVPELKITLRTKYGLFARVRERISKN